MAGGPPVGVTDHCHQIRIIQARLDRLRRTVTAELDEIGGLIDAMTDDGAQGDGGGGGDWQRQIDELMEAKK